MTNTSNPDQRLDRVEQRLDTMESRLESLEGEFRDQGVFLLEGLRALSAQTTNLANQVDSLAEEQRATQNTVNQLAQSMGLLIPVVQEMQAEITQIWQYLLRQSGNGGSGR